jgi:zinc and cadmium transporter
MSTLAAIILATMINGLVAFAGAFSLVISPQALKKILIFLVAFSAGALLGGAFLHLIPEAITELNIDSVFAYALLGFAGFFLIERFLHWHHCHREDGECKIHPVSYLILFGDGIHNFIDGLVIASSFIVNIHFGIITTLLIISHEFPQELGDFGVLVHAGMEKKKALIYNFISQLTSVAGGIIGYFLAGATEFKVFMLPIAAGGFIYIAASDLIPELHKEPVLKKSIANFLFFIVGIGFIVVMRMIFGE